MAALQHGLPAFPQKLTETVGAGGSSAASYSSSKLYHSYDTSTLPLIIFTAMEEAADYSAEHELLFSRFAAGHAAQKKAVAAVSKLAKPDPARLAELV